MVSDEAIGKALRELENLTPTNAARRVTAIMKRQAELATFVAELSEPLPEEASFVCLSMTVLIVRSFEVNSSEPVKAVSRRTILRAMHKNDEEIFTIMEEGPDDEPPRPARSPTEPHLLAMVVETLAEVEKVKREERAMMLLILKTVIDAMHATTKAPRRTPRLKLVGQAETASHDERQPPPGGRRKAHRPTRTQGG